MCCQIELQIEFNNESLFGYHLNDAPTVIRRAEITQSFKDGGIDTNYLSPTQKIPIVK